MKSFDWIRVFFVLIIAPNIYSIIITSVYGGRKKFKTIAFDFLLPPMAFEKPNKLAFAYRGHYTIKPPNFKLDMKIPLSLPVTPYNPATINYPPPIAYNVFTPDHYEPQPTNEEADHAPAEEESENSAESEDSVQEADQPVEQPADMTNYPAYIRNGGYPGAPSTNVGPYVAQATTVDNPRPYTGKAQVSSFIDNGQFVTATKDYAGGMESEFGDQGDGGFRNRYMNEDTRRTKTIPIGYERIPPKVPSYITAHAAHPDSMPYGMDYEGLQKYYTTFQFTDSLRGKYQPYEKRKGLFGFNKLFPTIG